MSGGDVKLFDYKSREAWLAARTQSIGASESAALFGLAPDNRESEYSLWAKKSGLVEPENIDEEWLFWGAVLEAPIAQRYAFRTGYQVWTPPSPWCVVTHPKLPFLTATVDRWVIEALGRNGRGCCEIKNVGVFNHDWKGDERETALPLYVQSQVQHQLVCTGFLWADVPALIGGNHLEIFHVERNPEFISELESRAEEFWRRVQTKDPPPIDDTGATTKALKRMHPDDDGSTVELCPEALDWVGIRETFKQVCRDAEAKVEESENRLRAALGKATFGTLPDGRIVSNKTTERKGFVVEPTKFRTLRVAKPAATPPKKGRRTP